MNRLFGILFILTGIFACAGGLYTWGDGSILAQSEFIKVLIPWADVLLTGPLSIISGYGILRREYWGYILGLTVSGVYIFGSILVFISILLNRDFTVFLSIPALSGLLIGLGFIWCVLKRKLEISIISSNQR